MNKPVICGVLAAATLCSCQIDRSILRRQSEKHPVRVKVTAVTKEDAARLKNYMGQAVPTREVVLSAPYSGTLKNLNVRKGNIVGSSDVVAEISSQRVVSSYNIAKADLDQANDAMDRVKKVYESGSVTQAQFVDIQTKLEKARATAASARKAVEDCSLKAPYRGVVSDIWPSVGEELAIGAKVLKITDISDLKIEIRIHENEISSIRTGMTAAADIPALGMEGVPAHVTEKGVLSSLQSHSYLCTLEFDRTPAGLMPGMAVKVHFENREGGTDIVIPASAAQIDAEGRYVWISESGTAVKRHIGTGGYSGKGIIVTEGLNEGDRVIVEGYQKVSGGMKITEVE